MSFAKQQTIETIRANIELQHTVWEMTTEAQRAKNEIEYKANKVRKYKIRLINEWRAKNQ